MKTLLCSLAVVGALMAGGAKLQAADELTPTVYRPGDARIETVHRGYRGGYGGYRGGYHYRSYRPYYGGNYRPYYGGYYRSYGYRPYYQPYYGGYYGNYYRPGFSFSYGF